MIQNWTWIFMMEYIVFFVPYKKSIEFDIMNE